MREVKELWRGVRRARTRERYRTKAETDGPVLQLRGVCKSFGAISALSEVDLDLYAGERLGIMGPNGAGKTTLTRIVMGEVKPDRGTIHLHGEEITGKPPYMIFRAGIGKTNQVARSFKAMTVIDVVSLGALAFGAGVREARARAYEALGQLQLTGIALRPMSDINVVESKLVELAKVMIAGCQVVILDELLAGLPENEIPYVMSCVDSCARDGEWGILMVEHLIGPLVSFCPRIIAFDLGRVVAEGPGDTVLRSRAVLEAYVGNG